MIGTTVGSYRIISELGQGGMGAIYLAEHTLMGKQAAVKVLLPRFCTVQQVVERFFNEAKAASMIKHPGVVDIFDFGTQEDGSAYIVMELLEGEELGQLISREVRLDSTRAALIAQQIAGALQAAHDMNIVHRDLKPDNVFLEPDSAATGGVRPKILDFGIAKLNDDLSGSAVKTRTGAVMGTPVFMSPEQCTGEGKVDHRSDIYSLGCILYMMVSGRPPFVKNGAGALIAAHITEAPAPVSHYEPSVLPDLEAIIMSTLAKDPMGRPQSMTALANALDSITGQTTSSGGHSRPAVFAATTGGATGAESLQIAKTVMPAGPPPTTLGASAGESALDGSSYAPPRPGPAKFVILGGVLVAAAAAALLLLGSSEQPERKTGPDVPQSAASESETATEPTTPADSTTIAIHIETDPPGFAVSNAKTGENLGATPYRGERNKEQGVLELTLKRDRYESKTISVALDQDFSEKLTLLTKKEAKARAQAEKKAARIAAGDAKKAAKAEADAKKAADRKAQAAAKKAEKAKADAKKAVADAAKKASDKRAADKRAADKRAADKRAADKRAADKRAADKRAADKRAADKKAAQEKATTKTPRNWDELVE